MQINTSEVKLMYLSAIEVVIAIAITEITEDSTSQATMVTSRISIQYYYY
jgi:hypothetical protein